MNIRFDGQAAIVTGAGGGLGFAIARELARLGCAVLVNDYGGPEVAKKTEAKDLPRVAADLGVAID